MARALYSWDILHDELEFLSIIFRQNGYSDQQIHRTLNPPVRGAPPSYDPDLVMFLHSVGSTFNQIGRLLSQLNIKSPPRKIFRFLQPGKDNLGLNTPGVYSIPRECGQLYLGQASCSSDIRLKEYH
jgi:hypothetical protein